MSKLIDLTGKRYGRLVVLERVQNHGDRAFWKCKCDCGNIKDIAGSALRYGRTNSCGCIAKEKIIKRNTKHGFAKRVDHSRLYSIWKGMLKRCYNQNSCGYSSYGERGIGVCDEWHDFTKFKDWAYNNSYSDLLSIDRIDVNGNYEPDNCRWVTCQIQSNNTRRTIVVTLGSVSHSLKEWCNELNLKYDIVKHRIKRGWDVYEAMFSPIKLSAKKVMAIDDDGNCFEYKSMNDAANAIGVSRSTIRSACNSNEPYKGYIWIRSEAV